MGLACVSPRGYKESRESVVGLPHRAKAPPCAYERLPPSRCEPLQTACAMFNINSTTNVGRRLLAIIVALYIFQAPAAASVSFWVGFQLQQHAVSCVLKRTCDSAKVPFLMFVCFHSCQHFRHDDNGRLWCSHHKHGG